MIAGEGSVDHADRGGWMEGWTDGSIIVSMMGGQVDCVHNFRAHIDLMLI